MQNKPSLYLLILIPLLLFSIITSIIAINYSEKLFKDEYTKDHSEKIKYDANLIFNMIKSKFRQLVFTSAENPKLFFQAQEALKAELIRDLNRYISNINYLSYIYDIERKQYLLIDEHLEQIPTLNFKLKNSVLITFNNKEYLIYKFEFKPFKWRITIAKELNNINSLTKKNSFIIGLVLFSFMILFIFILTIIIKYGFKTEVDNIINFFKQNNTTKRIDLKNTTSELENIKIGINSAYSKINKYKEDLIKVNQTLEEQINERTKDLTFYKNIFDDSGEGIFVIDIETAKFINVNDKACKLLGYTKEEIIGQNFNFIRKNDPTKPPLVWKKHIKKLKKHGTIESTGNLRRKDGSSYPVETSVNYILEGNKYRMVSFTRDITDKYKTEILKKEAFKIAKLGSWSLDINSNKLTWSDEIYDILEINKDSIDPSYELFLNLIHPDDKNKVEEAYKTSIKNKTPYSIKHRILLKNDKIKWVQEEGKNTYSIEGKPLLSIGTIQDITIQYEQEELIIRQSKHASMGEMIGNIAHQWRQPLSVISTGISSLKLQKELDILTDEQFDSTCDTINKNTNYLSKTIDDFRNFIKGDRIRVRFNLNENIESFLQIIAGSAKNNEINIIKNLKKEIELYSYPNELTQCFMNIFNNSKDALINNNYNTKRYLFIFTNIEENNVVIKFKDNAYGIKDEILPKIFEPYFTTKHQSIGTGLGLHMVYNLIVDGLNGNIIARNSIFEYNGIKMKGAEFIITLLLENNILDKKNTYTYPK